MGVDFDDCIGDDGTIAQEVRVTLAWLNTYAKRSPSGRGVKAIGRGHVPGDRHTLIDARAFGCKRIELDDRARFFTITGQRLDWLPAEPTECQAAIDALYAVWFPPAPAPSPSSASAPRPCRGMIPTYSP